MNSHLLTLGTNNNFSIASLITSDCYNDENHLFHSMTNSIGSNLDFSNYSIDKLTHDYYPSSFQTDPTLFNTSTEQQYPPTTTTTTKKKDNQPKTNHRKRSNTKGHMEGEFHL